jgi:hypothetical protein
MLHGSLFALCALASIATAQIPIPPATNNFALGNTIGGFWFQAPGNGNLAGIRMADTAGLALQAIEVVDFGGTAPLAFPAMNQGAVLYSNRTTPAATPEPVVIPLIAGRYYGILGGCMDTPTSTNFNVSQASGGTSYTSSILGQSVTLTGLFHFNVGSGNYTYGNALSSVYSFGRVEAFVLPPGPGAYAYNTAIGSGCGGGFTSFYERFASATAFDLANTSISMVPGFGFTGYTLLPGLRPFVPPTASATSLPFTNDSTQFVVLSSPFAYVGGASIALGVSDNGSVSAGFNLTTSVPDVGQLLDSLATGWWMWHDYDPTLPGSGGIKFEEVGGIAYVTWDGVRSPGSAGTDTFQYQFELATGIVTIAWESMGAATGDYVVGYSPAGPSANPGGRDLSAMQVLALAANDSPSLAVAATSRPILGSAWNLTTQNVPATAFVGVDVFGLSDPGIDDLSAFGAPGCGLRAALDVTSAWTVASGAHAYSLAIPNTPSLLNLNLYTTSAVFQPPTNNALGVSTGNGVRGSIGSY